MITKGNLSYFPDSGNFIRNGKVLRGMSKGYLTGRFEGKVVKLHRLAWFFVHNTWPEFQIDHIDGDKTNNSYQNLRIATTSFNCHNQFGARTSNKKTGLQGVKVHKRKSGSIAYRASISIKGKDIHLGLYETPEEAHQVYLKKKMEVLDTCPTSQ